MGTRNSFGGNAVHRKGLAEGARTALCLFMAALLAITMTPLVPQAEAAQNEPTMTVMMTMPDGRTADVTKVVMTLNGGDKAPVKFKVTSNASPQSRTGWLVYELVDDDEEHGTGGEGQEIWQDWQDEAGSGDGQQGTNWFNYARYKAI